MVAITFQPVSLERETRTALPTNEAAFHLNRAQQTMRLWAMRQFHKPIDEKRMVVILEPDQYAAWLDAPSGSSTDFMQPYPADLLVASAPAPIEGVLF